MAGSGSSIIEGFSKAAALNPVSSCTPAIHCRPQAMLSETDNCMRGDRKAVGCSCPSSANPGQGWPRDRGLEGRRQALQPGFSPSRVTRADAVLAVICPALSGLAALSPQLKA